MKYTAGAERNVCIIDAKTGEIIEINNHSKEPNRAASTEAPDGMISEAEAQVIVLDDLGITDRELKGFTIELKESDDLSDSYYEISITDFNDVSYVYKVDAVSGQILGKGGR